ncbi:MBL fold metallo-hydrolase [Planctomycetales bacterium ZRK34]|nr:MBL fold metallo-hydrolase [Planctomycetales bacterium ZRK34]
MFDYRIISIGALSAHPLWNESPGLRTAHATTTLIRSGDRNILVDPSLPTAALAARLHERSGLRVEQITDVFLTCFRPAHRRALPDLTGAAWWISEVERESIGVHLIGQFERDEDPAMHETLKQDIALLKRCKSAPDQLAEHVDLFPLPGYSPGTCGLLLPLTGSTVLIAGDAIPTVEHLEQGKIFPGAYDVNQATESFKEAVEIADVIIPGHDNITPNRTRQMF